MDKVGAMITRGVCNEGDTSRDFTCSVHHVSRWLWALAFGLLVAGFGLGNSVAFAATEEVLLSDQMAFEAGSDEVRSGWMMLAYNDFNAAVLVIGQNPQDYRLDLDVRAKLSNESTGGAFYELSQDIHDTGASGNDLPSWAAGLYGDFGSIWGGTATNNGMGIYWCEVSPELIAAAKADYLTILQGGDVGGGGGSGGGAVSGDYYEFSTGISYFDNADYSDYYITGTDGKRYTNVYRATTNSNYYLLPSNVRLRIPTSCLDSLNSYFPFSENSWYAYVGVYAGKLNFVIVAGNVLSEQTATQTLTYNNLPTITNSYLKQLTYTYQSIRQSQQPSYVDTYTYEDGVITYTGNNVYSAQLWQNGNSFWNAPQLGGFYLRGVDSLPVIPPSNWPDNPEVVTPTPPSLPTPSNPTAPTYIMKPTYVSNTYTADLQGILDALDEHCQHLQDSIFDNVSGYYDAMSGFLGQEFAELRDYLHELFNWLASQMDFTFTAPGYNDSSVISWLKRIYSKLSRGPVNTRPVDPVADPDGVGNWFEQLLKNFLGALFGIGSEAVNGLLDALGELKEKFPFSIPWDIAAMLMLLGAHPVAPAFDIPLYTLTASGLQQVGQYEIDLDVFSPYMAGIRDMETIVFAACLAFKTDFFKGMLEIKKG